MIQTTTSGTQKFGLNGDQYIDLSGSILSMLTNFSTCHVLPGARTTECPLNFHSILHTWLSPGSAQWLWSATDFVRVGLSQCQGEVHKASHLGMCRMCLTYSWEWGRICAFHNVARMRAKPCSRETLGQWHHDVLWYYDVMMSLLSGTGSAEDHQSGSNPLRGCLQEGGLQ